MPLKLTSGKFVLPLVVCSCITIGIVMIFAINQSLMYLFPLESNSYKIFYVENSEEFANESDQISVSEVTIGDFLQDRRNQIVTELSDFSRTEKTFDLSHLSPESGGTPVRNVILSTWLSGYDFIGDILKTIPGNYYHFESLSFIGNERLRESPSLNESLHVLKQLLRCDYTPVEEYLKKGRDLFSAHNRISTFCELLPSLCKDAKFPSAYCKIFPFQTMNLVRLPVELSEPLLSDPDLNVKILLLVRDPRGTMAARKNLSWCRTSKDCGNSDTLCKDLVSDYNAAKELMGKYPSRLKAIRFEDLTQYPFNVIEEILNFFGLPFHENVMKFLASTTGHNSNDLLSPMTNFQPFVFPWMRELNFRQVEEIQSKCLEAMSLWGYQSVDNEQSLESSQFDSLKALSISN